MFEAWFLTVFSEIPRLFAISLLLLPLANALTTSSSRSVSLGAMLSASERIPSNVESVFLAMS